jgi:hypothetical protein
MGLNVPVDGSEKKVQGELLSRPLFSRRKAAVYDSLQLFAALAGYQEKDARKAPINN